MLTKQGVTSAVSALLLLAVLTAGVLAGDVTFTRMSLKTVAETNMGHVPVIDVNGDGVVDIVAGLQWFEGPSWKRHPLYPPDSKPTAIDIGFTVPYDLDGDGDLDLTTHRRSSDNRNKNELLWFENPGPPSTGVWTKHHITWDTRWPEIIIFVDIDGDGRDEMICSDVCPGKGIRIYEIPQDPKNASNWSWTTVDKSPLHGLGIGDLNEDGRLDIVSDFVWFEQDARGGWTRHSLPSPGSARRGHETMQIKVYDVDADGDVDLILPRAHHYGAYWLESSGGKKPSFKLHEILPGKLPSQLHGVAYADIDGDGDLDIFAGKSRYRHGDPGNDEPLDVFWIELVRTSGRVGWVKHQLATDLTMGIGPTIADVDADGDMDLVLRGHGIGGRYVIGARQTDVTLFIQNASVTATAELAAMAASAVEPLPIIPGAAGFGMETVAGSGRHLDVPKTRVIKVTNLNPSGPGSLRAALEAEGPRVVVFEVSGNIDFTPVGGLRIKHPYVTVAGQTAPSPGITLKGCQVHVGASDVLLQHIRVRVGDLLDPSRPVRNEKSGWTQYSERDCMKVGRECRGVVIDHCSFSWATDENVQTRGGNLTFIHNIFSEGLDSAKHHKGGHSRGLLIMKQGKDEGQNIAVIGNLFVHNKGRNPTINGGAVAVIANNLVDDAHFAMKGDCTAKRGHQLISATGNVIKRTRYFIVARAKHPQTRYYFAPDNIFNGKTFDSVADVWQDVFMPFEPGVPEVCRTSAPPVTVPGLRLRPVSEVEEWVLANAGARPADRDPVDKRIVSDVRNGTGKIIASQEDVGGWPKLAENRRKLTIPENPNGDDDGDGNTNLEEWLHGYAAEVEGKVKVGTQAWQAAMADPAAWKGIKAKVSK